jgi:hypothetical protein
MIRSNLKRSQVLIIMKIPIKGFLSVFSLLALTAVGLLIWHYEFHEPTGKGRWESSSPDGRFTITTYAKKGLIPFPVMPGQGGDAPGIIVLRDKNGQTLQKSDLELVNGFGDSSVRWGNDSVVVVSIGEWPLPSDNHSDE